MVWAFPPLFFTEKSVMQTGATLRDRCVVHNGRSLFLTLLLIMIFMKKIVEKNFYLKKMSLKNLKTLRKC